jgi:hypothetical protein
MAQVNDSMSNDWWRNMYSRYVQTDPSNKNYSFFNQPGLTQPLTVASNPQYVVDMQRHQDGVNTYQLGGVTPQAAALIGQSRPRTTGLGVKAPASVGQSFRPTSGAAACNAASGDPSGCMQMAMQQSSAASAPMRYSRLG